MIGVKALLMTFAGIRAIPPLGSAVTPDVHDLANVAQTLSAGHRRITRLSQQAGQASVDGDLVKRGKAIAEQSEIRTALDDLARRLG